MRRLLAIVAVSLSGCVSDVPMTPNDSGGADQQAADQTSADAGDAATEMTPAWTPKDLGSQLVVWLEGSNVQTAQMLVSNWPDQSGNGNDGKQPSPIARGEIDPGVANGRDAVLFKTSNFGVELDDKASVQFGQFNEEFVIEAVVFFHSLGNPQVGVVWSKTIADCSAFCTWGDGILFTIDMGGHAVFRTSKIDSAPVTSPETIDDTKFHIVAARRAGPNAHSVRVDGKATVGNSMEADVSTMKTPVFIGAPIMPGPVEKIYQTKFEIAELVALYKGGTGSIFDKDVAALEQYFKAKYKTP